MRRVQKITATVSVIVVLVLAVALGIFLWKEDRSEAAEEAAVEAVAEEEAKTEKEADAEREAEAEKEAGSGKEGISEEGISEEEPETSQEEQEMLATKEPQDLSMLFTGDIMLSDSVLANYAASGLSGILSEELQNEMQQADVTMINEEFPFSTRGTPAPDKQFTFRIDPSYVKVFQEMGVDIVSLANNHALDYGTDALLDSFAALDGAGIPYVGAGDTRERAAQPVYMEQGGRTVGFLAASRVIPQVSWNVDNQQPGLFCTYDSTALETAIRETKQQCDYLVVYVHWGVERQNYPEEYQRSLAQTYIDAGADLVVGSHPHVPQGIEYYQGKPIIYSLGNYIFNASSASTYALKVVWAADGASRLTLIPLGASNALTSRLEGQEAEELLRYIESISYGVTIDAQGQVTAAE